MAILKYYFAFLLHLSHSVDFTLHMCLCLQAGTVIYVAPEVLRGRYTLSADLW